MRIFQEETARKVPKIVLTVFGCAIVLLLAVLLSHSVSNGFSSEELTPEEIAHIDSVKVLIANAPIRSLIDFKEPENKSKPRIQVVTQTRDDGTVLTRSIGRSGYSGNTTEAVHYHLQVKTVAYPGTEEHDSLSVELVMGN